MKNWRIAGLITLVIVLLMDGRVWGGTDCSKAQEVLDQILVACATECPDCVCDVQCGETYVGPVAPPPPVVVPDADCWDRIDPTPSSGTWQLDVGAGASRASWYPEVGMRWRRFRVAASYVTFDDTSTTRTTTGSVLLRPGDSCDNSPLCGSPVFANITDSFTFDHHKDAYPVLEASYVVWKSKR